MDFVAQVCHIEAALPKGGRFNEYMTNEERRSFDNLVLLCYPHHVATDDVDKYTVEVMQAMKRSHEAKFQIGIDRLIQSVGDQTLTNQPVIPSSFDRFMAYCDLPLDGEEFESTRRDITTFVGLLSQLSLPARQTLEIVVRRGIVKSRPQILLSLQELQDVTGMGVTELVERVAQLEQRGLGYHERGEHYDMPGDLFALDPRSVLPDWPEMILDLREFAKDDAGGLHRMFVDLDFSPLDKPDAGGPGA